MYKKQLYTTLLCVATVIGSMAQSHVNSTSGSDVPQVSDTTVADKFNLDEVVITATRSPKKLSQSPVVTQVITAKQIENRGISDIRNLLEQEIPGLVFNEVGFGTSINLQGLSGKHILFLIDGERMAGETGDNIDYNRLDLSNVERIEIVQGASSALYGSQAMGGVINVITRKASKPFYTNASVKWAQPYQRNYMRISGEDIQRFFKKSVDRPNLNADVTVGGKWRLWTARSSFSLKSADAYRLFDTDSVSKYFAQHDTTVYTPLRKTPSNVSGFESRQFIQSIGYSPTERLTLSAKGNLYTMNKFDLTPDNKHEYNTDLSATLTAAYRFNEHSDLQLTVYGDNYSKNNKLELLNGRKDLIYRHRIFQPRALYTVRVASKHFVNAGVEYLDETLYTDKFSSGSYETRRQQAVSVFVQDDWRISTHFSITGGIRSDYNNIYGYNLSPKVALLYKMFPFSFRFNYAAGYRSPSLKELYMNWDHFGMFWIYGNRNLRPEHNHYFSLSAEFVSERVYALSTGYINLFSNKIEGIWSANQTELHYRNISSATLAGINTNLRYNPFGKLFLHASANFLYPAKTGGVRLNTQSKLSGTMRAEYGLDLGRHHLAFNLSGTILGEKSYNVLETIRINGTDTEAYYTAYVPAYSLWNAAATYRLSEQARLTVGINNLFNYSARIINFNTYTGVGRNLFAALALQL